MSEFERLLEAYVLRIGPIWNTDNADRAALIAYHERVVRERDNWQETAARHWSNELFYSGLLRDVGSLFPDCYVSDDGSVQDQPLALKVKECVQAALAERDARIAELEPDAERLRWLCKDGPKRRWTFWLGHNVKGGSTFWPCYGGEDIRAAIDAARKAKEEP